MAVVRVRKADPDRAQASAPLVAVINSTAEPVDEAVKLFGAVYSSAAATGNGGQPGVETPVVAASTSSEKDHNEKVDGRSLLVAVAFAAFGFILAVFFHNMIKPTEFRVSADWSAFGALFVLAAGIERLIEPFSEWLGPSTSDAAVERDKKLQEALKNPDDKASDLANAQAKLKTARVRTVVVTWGAATAIAFVGCALLGVGLLSAIRDSAESPPFLADLALSGLVVGAGTKPLHDLVSNVQKNKEDKKDPKETK